MLIESPRIGTIEILEEQVIAFPDGLLGFRDFKRYYLHEPSEGSALKWMQCVDLPALGFVVIDPLLFKPDYEVKISAAQLEPLRIADPESALVFVILTIPEDPRLMTANLQGPIVVNPTAHLAAQVVLNEEGVTTKFPVLEALRAQGRA